MSVIFNLCALNFSTIFYYIDYDVSKYSPTLVTDTVLYQQIIWCFYWIGI